MPEVATDLAPAIVEACRAGLDEMSAALGRTFGTELRLELGSAQTYDERQVPIDLQGPGLAVLIQVGQRAMLAAFPELGAILPAWYAKPDATGTSKLATLAQELSLLAMPPDVMADDTHVEAIANLAAALMRGRPEAGALRLPLTLTTVDGRQSTLHLFWPLTAPAAVGNPPKPATPPQQAASQPAMPAAKATPAAKPAAAQKPKNLEELPKFTRSLLKIRVSVLVILAAKRTPLNRVVDLGPGSIIHFEKSCEEMLTLEVGGQSIAEGEPVKVGDKFGIRLTSVVIPPEQFKPIARR
jgi:flagellar motor switch/type III secretory pathway protein FliN